MGGMKRLSSIKSVKNVLSTVSITDYTFKMKATSSTMPTTEINGTAFTNTGAVTLFNDGTRGYVFNFTGANYLTLSIPTPTLCSKSLWVSTSIPTFNTGNCFSTTKFPIWFNGTLSLILNPCFTTTPAPLTSSTTQTITWIHYVMTMSATTMCMYVNGNLLTSRAVSGWSGDSANTVFGAYQTASYYKGYLDDMRLYPYTLTASQVSAIYTAG